MMISQSNFNNQETRQIPEQKIYQVPNFYGEIKSTEPRTPTLQDGGFSFDEFPPPPPSPPPGPSGAHFYVGTPPSPEHMTMVFPPPREYSCEDINLELQGKSFYQLVMGSSPPIRRGWLFFFLVGWGVPTPNKIAYNHRRTSSYMSNCYHCYLKISNLSEIADDKITFPVKHYERNVKVSYRLAYGRTGKVD